MMSHCLLECVDLVCKQFLRSLAEGHPWNLKVPKPSMLLEQWQHPVRGEPTTRDEIMDKSSFFVRRLLLSLATNGKV